jgi:hypothetical protein
MARLTLARKMAAITLILWKKEARFDAEYLKRQAAWASLPEISKTRMDRRFARIYRGPLQVPVYFDRLIR